jgi:hypothetical protein
MLRVINSFRGEAPRVTPRALPDNAAQVATNARLLTGDLTAWKQFAFTKALANYPTVETIYKLNGAWLSWTHDVDVARGIIPGDTTFRTYLTGLDVPRFTNYSMATSGPEPWPAQTRILGVPAPHSPPTLVISSGGATISVTDSGDQLSSWVVSGDTLIPGSAQGDVSQSAVTGNPAPSYRIRALNSPAAPSYMYRDFGVGSSAVVEFDTDFFVVPESMASVYEASWRVANTLTGSGPVVTIGFPQGIAGGPFLLIGVASGWNSPPSWLAQKPIAALAGSTWYRMAIKLVRQASGNTLSCEYSLVGVPVDNLSTTGISADGAACGMNLYTEFTAAQITALTTFYDNIQLDGSGVFSGITPATSYVYTFANDLGEESAPSLPSETITRPEGVAVTVTTPTTLPTGVSTDYGIATKRIYRAATGNTGTIFRFVAEIPLSQDDYVDTLTDAELGEALQSEIWALPPDDLRGILALPNGIMVGFRRNQLCFSAQNHPHAWPIEYRLNTDTDIVGIGNIDNTVVIGTESFVYVATGNDPAAYSMSKFEVPYACMSKLSFAYLTGIGVVFSGTDGLMAVAGIGQVRNLTDAVFTDTQWKALDPTSMRGVAHNDIYFLFWDNGATQGCYAIDMKATGFGVVPMSFHASAAYVDPVGDVMFLVLDSISEPDDPSLPLPPTTPPYVDGTHIYEFEGSDTDSLTYRYRGKLWLLERPATMVIAQVRAESYENILFRVIADGAQVDEFVITEETEFTLTSVDEYTSLEFEVLGTSTVRVIQAAEDVSELS